MINMSDFVCFNATIFYKDFLKTKMAKDARDLSLDQFAELFTLNPLNKKIIVSSKEEAVNYLMENNIDLDKVEAIYLSKEYHVERLNRALGLAGY